MEEKQLFYCFAIVLFAVLVGMRNKCKKNDHTFV